MILADKLKRAHGLNVVEITEGTDQIDPQVTVKLPNGRLIYVQDCRSYGDGYHLSTNVGSQYNFLHHGRACTSAADVAFQIENWKLPEPNADLEPEPIPTKEPEKVWRSCGDDYCDGCFRLQESTPMSSYLLLTDFKTGKVHEIKLCDLRGALHVLRLL